jgi:hypothetical protein
VAGKLGVERDVISKARQYGIRAQSTLRLPQRGDLWRALRECEAMQRLNEHHRREPSGDSGDAPAHDPCAGSQRGRARRPKPPQVLWFCLPRPLPTAEGIGAMPLGFQALKDIVVILHKGVPPLRVAERG